MKEAISGMFKSAFNNGNLKRGGFVAVPTALVTVVGTILAQQYLLPQPTPQASSPIMERIITLESGYAEMVREREAWRVYHKDWGEQVAKRLEENVNIRIHALEVQAERIETKVDRLLRRDL